MGRGWGLILELGSNPASVERPSARLNFLALSERGERRIPERIGGGVKEILQARAHTQKCLCT